MTFPLFNGSPDLRMAIPHAVNDPFLYIEHDGHRRVVVRSLELARMQDVMGLEAHAEEDFGLDELQAAGLGSEEVPRRIAVAACQHRRQPGVGLA